MFGWPFAECGSVTGARVLVTGASGVLGAAVVGELAKRGVSARGLGRATCPAGFRGDWAQVDLLSGKGLADAFADVRSVVHCASNPQQPRDDLEALGHLTDACRTRGAHLIYISIAGIEDAASSSAYFRAKRDCEGKLAASGCQYTIVRAAQFHPFVEFLIERLTFGPLQLEPRLTLQPVDPKFVAENLVTHSLGQPQRTTPDLSGPERSSISTLMAQRLTIGGARKLRLPMPAIGPLAAFQKLRVVEGRSGGRTWLEWLEARRGVQFDHANHR